MLARQATAAAALPAMWIAIEVHSIMSRIGGGLDSPSTRANMANVSRGASLAHQWLDRPKMPLSEQSQVGKERIAINQESGEEPRSASRLQSLRRRVERATPVRGSTVSVPPGPQPGGTAGRLAAFHRESIPLGLVRLEGIEALKQSAVAAPDSRSHHGNSSQGQSTYWKPVWSHNSVL